MIGAASKEVILAALTFLPSDERELWLKVGMALKLEFSEAGFDIYDVWSKSAENYNPKAIKSTWKSFKRGSGVTIATIIAEAKRRGFDPKKYELPSGQSLEERKITKEIRANLDRAAAAEIAEKHEVAATEAGRTWSQASETGVSPYFVRKKVVGYGARYIGSTALIPLIDAKGKIWNLQRIFSKGDKFFMSDARVSGLYFVIGDAANSARLLIAEGFATGATLHEATGYAVFVAFNEGNIKNVAQAVRKQFPTADILICADDDRENEAKRGKNPGVAAATAAAKLVKGTWCKPSDLHEGGTDFNDLMIVAGIDAVRAQIAAASSAEPAISVEKANPKKGSRKSAKSIEVGDSQPSRPYFRVDDGGVWHHGFSQQGDALPPQWICSELRVTAKSRDTANGDWGYLLEFRDSDGNQKRWAMPASMLAGDGTAYRSTLLSMGLQIAAGVQSKNLLTVYIQTRQTDVRVRCTDRIGWHDNVYVLPDTTIGEGDELVMFQSPGGVVSQFKQRGELEHWKCEVAALCRGNSRLVFCVSAAFAAPLLYHSGVPSGGFHIWGDSSSGKSTAFKVAGSVFGGRDYPRNWRMTDNSLELVAAQHSDALLLLDEIAQVDPKVVGDTVYMLANETGKGRATQTATARKVSTWRVLFLSDGEVSLANHMSEAGKGTRGGHDVRMAHIAADAGGGFGVYDTLHDFANGAALSDHLVKMAHQYYGVAGMEFIKRTVSHGSKLIAPLRARLAEFSHELCPSDAHGQVARVALRFALVGVAGELASTAGITGWEKGESLAAARTCFGAWLDGRGGKGNTEHTSIIRQVSGFFQMHGDARFTWWHRASDDHRPNTINRAGFKRMVTELGEEIKTNSDHGKEFGDVMHPTDAEKCETEFFVLPEVFRVEICKGFSTKAVAHLLIERGLLMPEGTGEKVRADRKERLPGIGSARCYRFSSKILTADV